MFDTTHEPLQTDQFYVVWFNRVSEEKMLEDLIEILKSIPSIELHAIGSGPLIYLFDNSNLLNLKKLGFLWDSVLSDKLRKAGLCIFTSRGKNFGMSSVEAQVFGVTTLSYNVMGLRDYNEVVEEREAMISRIRAFYEKFTADKESYLNMRRKLREETLKKFSNIVVLPQIKKVMTE